MLHSDLLQNKTYLTLTSYTHTHRKQDSSAAEGRKRYSEQIRLCECYRGRFSYRAMWVPAGQCSETGEEGGLGSLQTVHKETLPPSRSHANESHFVRGLKNSQGSEQRRFKPTIEPQFSREKPTMLSLCLSRADKEISMDVWVSGCIRHWQSVMYRDHNSLTHTFPETGIDQLSWKAGPLLFLTFSVQIFGQNCREWFEMELSVYLILLIPE